MTLDVRVGADDVACVVMETDCCVTGFLAGDTAFLGAVGVLEAIGEGVDVVADAEEVVVAGEREGITSEGRVTCGTTATTDDVLVGDGSTYSCAKGTESSARARAAPRAADKTRKGAMRGIYER